MLHDLLFVFLTGLQTSVHILSKLEFGFTSHPSLNDKINEQRSVIKPYPEEAAKKGRVGWGGVGCTTDSRCIVKLID